MNTFASGKLISSSQLASKLAVPGEEYPLNPSEEAGASITDVSNGLQLEPFVPFLGVDKLWSFPQRVHSAFDARNELLRHRYRCTLQFVLGLVDLALDVLLFVEQFF